MDNNLNTTACEQAPENADELVFKRIETNRKSGLENLEHKISNFDSRATVTKDTPITEGMIRDIESAIRSCFLVLESTNSLLNMIIHDLPNVIMNAEKLSADSLQTSAHLQTIATILQEKGMITKEELKETWNRVIKPQLEKLKEQQEELAKQAGK